MLLALGLVGCGPGTFFADSPVDVDGDGFVPETGDCDDREPAAHPNHPEICDGIDNDCDGAVDGSDPDVGDADEDGSDACSDRRRGRGWQRRLLGLRRLGARRAARRGRTVRWAGL